MILWLLGAGALWLMFGDKAAEWAKGEGPFDQLPPGTDPGIVSVNNVKSSAGRAYKVTEYKRDRQSYYVAVRSDGSSDWVGYLFDNISKARVLYRANAETTEGIADLRKDFGL